MDVNHLSVPRNSLHARPKEEKDGRELFQAQASSFFFANIKLGTLWVTMFDCWLTKPHFPSWYWLPRTHTEYIYIYIELFQVCDWYLRGFLASVWRHSRSTCPEGRRFDVAFFGSKWGLHFDHVNNSIVTTRVETCRGSQNKGVACTTFPDRATAMVPFSHDSYVPEVKTLARRTVHPDRFGMMWPYINFWVPGKYTKITILTAFCCTRKNLLWTVWWHPQHGDDAACAWVM